MSTQNIQAPQEQQEINLETLSNELYQINSTSKFLQDIYKSSRIVDLEDINEMLVKVQEQIQGFKKPSGLLSRLAHKFKPIAKITDSITKEIQLQQTITDYVETTLDSFDEKYNELLGHLKVFSESKESFKDDVIKLDKWITKATGYRSKTTEAVLQAKLDRLITEAKSEVKRKYDTLETLINPMITAGQKIMQQINDMTPVLRNILYAELKTMVGINSFRDAASMMLTLKESIIEIQKLNIRNSGDAILEILENTKTNLMSKEDMEEMGKLRNQVSQEIQKSVQDIMKAQKENQVYMDQKYNELVNNSSIKKLEIQRQDDIEVVETEILESKARQK